MKNKEKFYSTALASTILILFFLIFVLFVASTANAQSASPLGPFAYITNSVSNNVSVIDTSTDTVIDTVPVGSYPYGIALNPTGTKVYVANMNSNNVYVIDTATNNVIATVSVGKSPGGVAVSPDGAKVYVANRGSFGSLGNTVSVIDTSTNNVSTVPVGNGPGGIIVNPAGTKVYVANTGGLNIDHTVSIFDTTTNNVTATIPVGKRPFGVAVSPDGTKVYVANIGDNTTSVINTSNNTVTATVPVGIAPFGISITPDGKKVYVANLGSKNVSVIDTANNTVTATVPVGTAPVAFGQFITSKTSITVISPNGGENWRAGTSQVIGWKYTGNPGRNVNIEVLKGGRSIISFITSTSSGSSDWFIPKTQMPGNDYKVRISSSTNSAYNNSSAGNFTISPLSVCNTSTISGYAFNDSNDNKIMDEGEDGLSNWTINLNGIDTCKGMSINNATETNSTGYFTFEDVNPGVYVISERFVVGWLPTTDASYTLPVPSNSTSIRKDFGNNKLVG